MPYCLDFVCALHSIENRIPRAPKPPHAWPYYDRPFFLHFYSYSSTYVAILMSFWDKKTARPFRQDHRSGGQSKLVYVRYYWPRGCKLLGSARNSSETQLKFHGSLPTLCSEIRRGVYSWLIKVTDSMRINAKSLFRQASMSEFFYYSDVISRFKKWFFLSTNKKQNCTNTIYHSEFNRRFWMIKAILKNFDVGKEEIHIWPSNIFILT